MKRFLLLMGIFGVWSVSFRQELSPDKGEPMSGVWIAAPQHNTILHNRQETDRQLAKLRKLGVNTLFLCVWADNKTAFKSTVLLENSNYKSLEDTWMFHPYVTPDGNDDPVAYLIKQAHKNRMKVIFWFEYGFMAQWGKEPTPDQHPILTAKPHWASQGNNGKTANYNGSDYYLNAYHPEVQQFLLDLIAESLKLYPEVDGIQGDDRLPASPANSGYDDYTTNLYRKSFNGQDPPADFRDPEWFKWRVGLLNQFAVRMRDLVKSKNKDYLMAFSPNPYPWCLENLMQDWPTWVEQGLVDMLNVQCYRTNLNSYAATAASAFDYAAAAGLDKAKFAPGIILGIASKKMVTSATLDSILQYNTQKGFGGQSFFYVKWLTQDQEFQETVRKN